MMSEFREMVDLFSWPAPWRPQCPQGFAGFFDAETGTGQGAAGKGRVGWPANWPSVSDRLCTGISDAESEMVSERISFSALLETVMARERRFTLERRVRWWTALGFPITLNEAAKLGNCKYGP